MTNKSREMMKENMFKQAQAAAEAVPANAVEERFERLERLTSGAAAPATPAAPVVEGPPAIYLTYDRIKDRDHDLRALSPEHVVDLAMSFVAVGMLHFPVVDQHHVLLAGGHRRAAVALLRDVQDWDLAQIRSTFERDPVADPLSDDDLQRLKEAYAKHFSKGIAVHVLDTTDMDADEVRLRVEILENEKRRDFSKIELAGVVTRLEEAGYKRTEGRPKAGQRVLSVELARIIGKSRATVFRVLKDLKDPPVAREAPSQVSVDIAKKASAQLETKVQVRESATTREQGTIVIHYNSFKQRSSLLRELGLKD